MKRILTPSIKLLILAAAACGLYLLWHSGGLRPSAEEEETAVEKRETAVGVRIGTIVSSTLHHYLTVYGTVEPQPGVVGKAPASARIMVPFVGLVADVHCIEGQAVEKGQNLFTLDGRAVETEINHAKQVLAFAQENYARHKQSTNPDQDPLRQLLKAQNDRDLAQAALDHALGLPDLLKIVAPLSGTVVFLSAKPGEVVDPNTVLAEVVDLGRLVIAANVPSSQLPAVKLGQPVEISRSPTDSRETIGDGGTGPATNPPATLAGQVIFIDDRVEPKTDMGSVDISIPPAAGLRLGQFVRVRIVEEERRNCLTVPADSIVKDADGKATISIVDRDWAVPQPVQIGLREGDMVEVQGADLRPGLTIVTTGAYGLSGKTKIHVLDK